ncbi:hypothetical protein ACEWY4_007015 [Coilia grayii]|uniref:Myb/SANT-like DNA-binding domain-containing protein n=1 Tax=Coilia grayii TaxID=363190 RepID=A0ABD1KFF8_9TELE
MCTHCGLVLLRKNLHVHMQRKHQPTKLDITAAKHLDWQVIDFKKGVFAVAKTFTSPCLITRLRAEMKNRSTYDKIFQKVWGASGGYAVVTCGHAVVYAVKFNVRAESPRDFADLLMSMKHFPNVTLYDFARGLATHANIREPGTFRPHEGRLLEPTLGNVALATSGQMEVDLPWLHQKKEDPDLNGHPLTGSADRYALYDRFHEGNTKDPKEVLRKIDLVPQLSGRLNSQCAEQLFSGMRKNNYFLNMMTPSSHIFLVRNILHHQNNLRNEATVDNMKKRLGGGVDIKLNRFGQTVLAESTGTEDTTTIDDQDPATTTFDDPDPATTAKDDPDPATTANQDTDTMCRPNCCGLRHLHHVLAGLSVTEAQVHTENAFNSALGFSIANCCFELIRHMAWLKEEPMCQAMEELVALERDLVTVLQWVNLNRSRFKAHVEEPSFARLSLERKRDIRDSVRRSMSPWQGISEDVLEHFLFIFHHKDDMEIFLANCRDPRSGLKLVVRWTGEQTRLLIRFRSGNEKAFLKSKMASKMQWQIFVKDAGLEGKVTGMQASKKWENLKQQYKEVRLAKTGSSTENGEISYSWQYYEDMHAVMAWLSRGHQQGETLHLHDMDTSLDCSLESSGPESPGASTQRILEAPATNRQRKRKADAALEFLQEEAREEKRRFEMQEAKCAARHEENADLMKQMLAICREMVQKM